MATDTTNLPGANGSGTVHESDIDHGYLTQANATPVVVQVPAGENVVRVQVTPGETIQLPFPIDAVVARLGDNGNLAVKVGDITVILLGYTDATAQAEVTLLGTDARPMDVAAVLASTDPNLDIQTAAGPAAGAQGAGVDNNGGVFSPFDPSDGIGGLTAVGGLDPTALNYNLIQRNFIEFIEDEPTETDTVPIVVETVGGIVNEDDLVGNYGNIIRGGENNDALAREDGPQSLVNDIITQFCWNPVYGNDRYDDKDYDGEQTKSGTPYGNAIIGYDPNGADGAPSDWTREPLVYGGTASVNFGPDVPGKIVFNGDTLAHLTALGLKSEGIDLQYQQIDDTHIQGYIFDGECYILVFTVAIGDSYPNPTGPGTTFDIYFILSSNLDHPLPAGGLLADETNLLVPVFFQAIDSDGSTAGGQITFGVRDDIPVIDQNLDYGSALLHPALYLDDDDLNGGNSGGTGDDDSSPSYALSGYLGVQYGADGAGTTLLTEPTLPTDMGFTTDLSSDGLTLIIKQDGVEVLKITLSDDSSGYMTVEQLAPIHHPAGQDENNLDIVVNFQATDGDGDHANGSITINVDDDTPVIVTETQREGDPIQLFVDETVRPTTGDLDGTGIGSPDDGPRAENDELEPVVATVLNDFGDIIGHASANLTTIFTSYSPGADGEKSHAYGLDIVNDTTDLIDTQSGEKVTLVKDEDGTVRGIVTVNNVELTVFALAVNADTGAIEIAQYRALDHGIDGQGNISFQDEVLALGEGYLKATLTVTDNDDDSVTADFDIGNFVRFEDDGPKACSNPILAFDDDLLAGGNPVDPASDDAPDVGASSPQIDGDGHAFVTGTLNIDFGSDGPGSVKLQAIGIQPTDGLIITATYLDDHTGATISHNGTDILTITINPTTGEYTVTQLAPWPHIDGLEENNATVSFAYDVVDKDGDKATNYLTINIDDDVPSASAASYDNPVATEGGDPVFLQSLEGFLADHVVGGADGYEPGSLNFLVGSLGGTLEVVANPNDGGALWIRYTPPAQVNDPTSPTDETFSYIISDNDGDTAMSTVTVKVADGAGPILAAAEGTVDEEGLQNGLLGTSYADGSDAPGINTVVGGTLSATPGSDPLAADNPFNLSGTNALNGLMTVGGTPVVLAPASSAEVGTDTVLTLVGYKAGGNPANPADQVFTLTLNRDTGQWEFELLQAVKHPGQNTEDNLPLSFGVSVSDVDGTTGNGSIVISIDDDSPAIEDGGSTVTIDETAGLQEMDVASGAVPAGIASLFASFGSAITIGHGTNGAIDYAFGADGPGEVLLTDSNGNLLNGAASGLFRTSDGAPILLFTDPSDPTVVLGKVGNTVVLAVHVDTTTNSLWVAQYEAIKHDDVNDPNDMDSTTSAIHLTVVDADGDAVTDIPSLVVQIRDDGPTARNDFDSVENHLSTDGNVITGAGTSDPANGSDAAGTDGGAAVVGIASVEMPANSATPTSDGVHGNGFVINGEFGSLTIYADGYYVYTRFNGNPLIDDDKFTYTLTDGDGDTKPATLTINIYDEPADLDVAGEGGTTVNETGLPVRTINAIVEPAGIGELADGDGTNNSNGSEFVSNFINFSTPDGFGSLTIQGKDGPITAIAGQVIHGVYGDLTVNTVNTVTGVLTYTYKLLDNADHSGGAVKDDFVIVVTDSDGDDEQGTVSINILDDAPVATNDFGGTVNTGQSINVVNPASGVLANDQFGADGAKTGGGVIGVIAGNGSTQSTTGLNTSIVTALGTLVLHADGTYTYTAKTNVSGTDYFTYTIEDGDRDRTTAVLSVNVADQAQGTISGTTSVFEDGMPHQNIADFTKQSAALGISFTPADNEVVNSLTIKNLPTGWQIFDGVTLLGTGTGADFAINTVLHPLGNLKILPPEDNSDQDLTLNITADIQDPNGGLTSTINGQLAITRDAVADKPTNVSITVTDAGGNGLFSVGENGTVNVKATFGDVADSSETHSLVVKIPAGFSLPDWNGSAWTGFPAGGVSVASVTGSAAAGWTVTFNVADNTSSTNFNLNVTNTAGVGSNATFSVDAKAVEDQFSGVEPDNTNNTAITSASVPVVSARILNGELITNTPSSQQGDQAMILTFVQDGQPLNAYSQVVVRDTQGQQGAVLADSGFNIDPSQDFNVALENPLEGHKIIVTDFNLEGVTLDVSGGNIQIEHEDASNKPMGVYAQMSPNDGGTVIVTDSIDGTSGNNAAHNGTAGQDYLYAGAGNDTLNGGAEDDVLNGGVGNDTLNGEAGNDVLVWNGGLQTEATNPALGDTYHGGTGFDLLRIDQGALFNSTISNKASIDFFPDQAADATVDLRGAHIDGIEGILLTEEAVITGSSQSGSNALGTKVLLNGSDVLNFSDTDTLYVIGSKGDVVDIDNGVGTNTGSATWAQGADVTPVVGGVTFATYTCNVSGQTVTLYVDKDVTVA